MMKVYLTQDPETGRITAQNFPLVYPNDFPRGRRGEGWELRELDVPAATYTKLDRGTYSPHAQDDIHHRWWDEAPVTGETTPVTPATERYH